MIDLLIVLAFIAYSIATGLRWRRTASSGLDEYFLAGRQVRGTSAGMSMAATQFAADTPLLVMGLIATAGVFTLWRLWIYALAFLLMGFLLAGPWRRAMVLTDAELVTIRYPGKGVLLLRVLKAVYYGTVINCVVMAFVLLAAVRIFEIFLPWNEWLPGMAFEPVARMVALSGIEIFSPGTALAPAVATTNNLFSVVALFAFVALYSTTGGLRSVIATDVAQLVLMLGGTAAYAWFAVDRAGGLAGLPDALTVQYGEAAASRFMSFTPGLEDALMPFLVVISLQWFFQVNSDGTGYLAQRTMACRSDADARWAAILFSILQIVVRSLMWLLIGLALLIVYPFDATLPLTETLIAQRELTFALGMDDLLPVGVRGVMLAAMLAALASTLDTHLNWGASYWSNDLYKAVWMERIRGREASVRELVLVARLSSLVIIAIAMLIMVNLDSIQAAWQMSLLFGAGTGAVLVLRWVWERVNLWSEVAAIVCSLVLAPVLLMTVEQEWLRLAMMSAASLLVVVVSAYWFAPNDTGQLVGFYRQVRPPGWWSDTERAAGLPVGVGRKLLADDMVGWLACAASLYCWLVGAGRLLIQAGSPWINAAVLLLGFALILVWRRHKV